MTHQDLYHRIGPLLAAKQLDEAIDLCEELLRAIPKTDYHTVLNVELDKLNPEFADWISDFYCRVGAGMTIRAIYAELNGFTINPDVWFVDMFAFDAHGGLDNLDWTGDWENGNSTARKSFAIEGFEQLQSRFMRDLETGSTPTAHEDAARRLSEFLVILRTQQLFQRTIDQANPNCSWKSIPYVVTAHDWDLVYETKA